MLTLFWKVAFSVFANVLYEMPILEGLFLFFLRTFGILPCPFVVNVSYETTILESFFVSFRERLVQNPRFDKVLCYFCECLVVFANVSYKSLLLEDFLVCCCECLVWSAPFGKFLCLFLRMSRTKRFFCKISRSVFAIVSYESSF